MTKYIEVYSREILAKNYDTEHHVTITPDKLWGYIAKLFVQEGKTPELAHEQASIASYTLSIDNNGKLQLKED
jgi:hypothetical protein